MYPTIVVCPKNADALNITLVKEGTVCEKKFYSYSAVSDVLYHLPGLDNESANALIAFAIAGAGFDNMGTLTDTWSSAEVSRLSVYFKRWKNSRSYLEFYNTLFNQYGYQCDEVWCSFRLSEKNSIFLGNKRKHFRIVN